MPENQEDTREKLRVFLRQFLAGLDLEDAERDFDEVQPIGIQLGLRGVDSIDGIQAGMDFQDYFGIVISDDDQIFSLTIPQLTAFIIDRS